MNTCIICQAELKETKEVGLRSYHCDTEKLPEAFGHYYISFDEDGKVDYQGYVIGKYFVQTYEGCSYIFLNDDLDMKEIVTVPRALWLNSTNFEQTLATVKLMVIMS